MDAYKSAVVILLIAMCSVKSDDKLQISSFVSNKALSTFENIFECFRHDEATLCAVERTQKALDDEKNAVLAEADAAYMNRRSDDGLRGEDAVANKPSILSAAISKIISELGELLGDSLTGLFGDEEGGVKTAVEEEEEEEEEEEDGSDVKETDDSQLKKDGNGSRGVNGDTRGKKKKKLKALIKLLILGVVLKAKLTIFLQLLQAHLQVKFFLIALAGLLLNKARFWLEVKKGHQPQKVIYYEHAQHQHHYDTPEEDEHGYWGRSFEESSTDQLIDVYPRPIQRSVPLSSSNNWSAFSSDVISDAYRQELAYRGQKPSI